MGHKNPRSTFLSAQALAHPDKHYFIEFTEIIVCEPAFNTRFVADFNVFRPTSALFRNARTNASFLSRSPAEPQETPDGLGPASPQRNAP